MAFFACPTPTEACCLIEVIAEHLIGETELNAKVSESVGDMYSFAHVAISECCQNQDKYSWFWKAYAYWLDKNLITTNEQVFV